MFQIEDNIEIPAFTRHDTKAKYPFKQMKVGQSFFVPCTKENVKKVRNSIASSARSSKVRQFTRVATHEGENGLRVWRVAPKEEANDL